MKLTRLGYIFQISNAFLSHPSHQAFEITEIQFARLIFIRHGMDILLAQKITLDSFHKARKISTKVPVV